MIRYKLIGGAIPEGCRITSDRGTMRVSGVAPLGASFNPPTFNSPSNLGQILELGETDIPLDITAQGGKNIIPASIIGGMLPWGLRLVNNAITGTVAELSTKVTADFLPEEAPQWTTRDGNLGEVAENQPFSINLETEGPSFFTVAHGILPWGLKLMPNGSISGTVGEDNSGSDPTPNGPGPIWNTARGKLGEYGEFVAVSDLSVSAVARTGTNIYYRLVNGLLPWGLRLLGNGSITGSTAELYLGGSDENPSLVAAPSISSQTIYSSKVSTPFSATVGTVIPSGRTMLSIQIVDGVMPLGLKLIGNTISGTPTVVGVYTFSMVVTDSDYVQSTPTTFTFEVTA